MAWIWHNFSIYRMPRATLTQFLKETFGDYDFSVEVGAFEGRMLDMNLRALSEASMTLGNSTSLER